MNSEKNSYIQIDDNKIINEKHIRWIRKIHDCLYVCTKSNGCSGPGYGTHRICKVNDFIGYINDSYNKLNKHFLGSNNPVN